MSSPYYNPNHPVVPARKLSTYSALSGAATPAPSSSAPPGIRVPEPPHSALNLGGNVKWNAATRKAECPPIDFDYPHGRPGQGIRMRDLGCNYPSDREKLARTVANANDPIGALLTRGLDWKDIRLRVFWPGYTRFNNSQKALVIHPFNAQGQSMTRGMLAYIVAERYARYFEKAQALPCEEPNWRWRG